MVLSLFMFFFFFPYYQPFSLVLLKSHFWSVQQCNGSDTFSQINSFPGSKLTAPPRKASQLFLEALHKQLMVRIGQECTTGHIPAGLRGLLPFSGGTASAPFPYANWRPEENILRDVLYLRHVFNNCN